MDFIVKLYKTHESLLKIKSLSGHNSLPTGAMHFLYTISIMTSHVFHAVKIFLKSEGKRLDTSLFSINEKNLICLTLVLVKDVISLTNLCKKIKNRLHFNLNYKFLFLRKENILS